MESAAEDRARLPGTRDSRVEDANIISSVIVSTEVLQAPPLQLPDRVEYVPVYEEKVKYVPVTETKESQVVVQKPVRKVRKERIVETPGREVPGEVIEVTETFFVDKKVEVYRNEDVEVPVIVSQTVKPVITESNEHVDVPVLDYEPEVQTVDVYVARPVESALQTSGTGNCSHKLVNITSAQYNTILRSLNSHLDDNSRLRLPFVAENSSIKFVPQSEVQYIVAPPGITIDDLPLEALSSNTAAPTDTNRSFESAGLINACGCTGFASRRGFNDQASGYQSDLSYTHTSTQNRNPNSLISTVQNPRDSSFRNEHSSAHSRNASVHPHDGVLTAQSQYGNPQNQYVDPQNQYVDSQNQYVDSQNQYLDPQKQYVDPQKQYVDPQNQYLDAQKQYVDPQNQYLEAQKPYVDAQKQLTSSQHQYSGGQHQYSSAQSQYSSAENPLVSMQKQPRSVGPRAGQTQEYPQTGGSRSAGRALMCSGTAKPKSITRQAAAHSRTGSRRSGGERVESNVEEKRTTSYESKTKSSSREASGTKGRTNTHHSSHASSVSGSRRMGSYRSAEVLEAASPRSRVCC